MPNIGDLDALSKSYGFSQALLLIANALLCAVIVQLYRKNEALHQKFIDVLDARGKYLDSILSEAINARTH